MIRILIVEDNAHHALLTRELLEYEYDQVMVYTASSLLEGETIARALLDCASPYIITFIIIDQQLPMRGYTGIEGSTLALMLREDMKAGVIQPAHLVAVSADMTSQRRVLARQAGCIAQWQKPLGYRQIRDLAPYIKQHPIIPESDNTNVAVATLAHSTIALLRSVMESHQPLRSWSPTDARILVSTLTPSLYITHDEADRSDELLKEFANDTERRNMIRAAIKRMPAEHSETIEQLLNGIPQSQIRSRLEMGRTKFENFLKQVFRELALVLGE